MQRDDLKADITNTFRYFSGNPAVFEGSDSFRLEGNLRYRVKDHEDLGEVTFDVIITIPNVFPKKLPDVAEKSEKIPRLDDYHIGQNGICCLGTKAFLFEYVHMNNIQTFTQYMETVILIFFFGVAYALKNKGKWPFETEDHGVAGIRDAYIRIFNVTEDELRGILKQKFKKHTKCFCGSGKRYDKCHGNYIPYEQIQTDIDKMKMYYENIKRYSSGRIPKDIRNIKLCDAMTQREAIRQRRY